VTGALVLRLCQIAAVIARMRSATRMATPFSAPDTSSPSWHAVRTRRHPAAWEVQRSRLLLIILVDDWTPPGSDRAFEAEQCSPTGCCSRGLGLVDCRYSRLQYSP
jgi:hypothetical protein